MQIEKNNSMRLNHMLLVITSVVHCLTFAARSYGAESADATLQEAKNLSYSVSNKAGLLMQKPQLIKSVSRVIEPTLGVEVDEVSLPQEGVTIQFLPNSGTPVQFSRQLDKLERSKANRSPKSREAIHANIMDMFAKLGMGDFTAGEYKISAEDWFECSSKIVPRESSEEVLICYCLSETLAYKGIPSLASFVYIKVSSETGELVSLLYSPTIGIDDIEAEITVTEAEQTASLLLKKREWTNLSHASSRLIIALPNHTFAEKHGLPALDIGNQRLSWEVAFKVSKRNREQDVRVFVDAKTGAVIGGLL